MQASVSAWPCLPTSTQPGLWLLCWAGDLTPCLPRKTVTRVLVFIAVTVAVALLLANNSGEAQLSVNLIVAAFYGYTLSCLWSPVGAVRALVRPLLRWRLPWGVYAIALLALPLLAFATVVVSRLLRAPAGTGPTILPGGLGQVVKGFFSEPVLRLPLVVGWYGFAARRLLGRYSPLAIGLLFGVALALASVLPVLRYSGLIQAGLPRVFASSMAIQVASVWLYQRSRGGLLALVVLQGSSTASFLALLLWGGLGLGGPDSLLDAFAATQCLLAVFLVVGWRMWHRPGRETRDAVVQTT